jgi:hypothetical protein
VRADAGRAGQAWTLRQQGGRELTALIVGPAERGAAWAAVDLERGTTMLIGERELIQSPWWRQVR